MDMFYSFPSACRKTYYRFSVTDHLAGPTSELIKGRIIYHIRKVSTSFRLYSNTSYGSSMGFLPLTSPDFPVDSHSSLQNQYYI